MLSMVCFELKKTSFDAAALPTRADSAHGDSSHRSNIPSSATVFGASAHSVVWFGRQAQHRPNHAANGRLRQCSPIHTKDPLATSRGSLVQGMRRPLGASGGQKFRPDHALLGFEVGLLHAARCLRRAAWQQPDTREVRAESRKCRGAVGSSNAHDRRDNRLQPLSPQSAWTGNAMLTSFLGSRLP